MKSKAFSWVAYIGVLVFALNLGALAQTPKPTNFSGLISDYTPQSVSGPWEVRGQWSLKVKGESGTADFTAAVAMVRSDLGVTLSAPGGSLNDPKARNAHTHHITLVDGTVTPITNGFRVIGKARITGNGIYPPPFGQSSTLQIDIIGGNSVAFSNIKLTFGGDAAAHFGSQPINGVVQSFK